MGITPSCFCPNFPSHSFWHWQEFPSLYAHTKPQNWTRIQWLPLSKAYFHQHQQHHNQKKNSKTTGSLSILWRKPCSYYGKNIRGCHLVYWRGHSAGRCLSTEHITSLYGLPMWSFPFYFPFWSPFLQNKVAVTLRSNTINYRSANKFCMWELVSTLFMQYQDLQDLSAQLLSSQSLFSPCDIQVLSPQVQNFAFADHQVVFLSLFLQPAEILLNSPCLPIYWPFPLPTVY